VNYVNGSWSGNVDAKFTGKSYSTLVNDQAVAATTLINAKVGYQFADTSFLKKPSIQFNVSNLFNRELPCASTRVAAAASRIPQPKIPRITSARRVLSRSRCVRTSKRSTAILQ